MDEPRYPDIVVQLTGRGGNAFHIMGVVSRAMLRAGVPVTTVDEYTNESMAGDYDNLLRVAQKWVTVQ